LPIWALRSAAEAGTETDLITQATPAKKNDLFILIVPLLGRFIEATP
jgi:hypothetical protein